MQHINKVLFLTLGFVFLVQTQAFEIIRKNLTDQTYGVSNSSPSVVVGLDFSNAFDIDMKSLDVNGTNFCKFYPSQIKAKLEKEIALRPKINGSFSFDNALLYKKYYFLLDTYTLNVLVVGDVLSGAIQWIIESDYPNEKISADENEDEYYEPLMTIDQRGGILFIATEKILLSYDTKVFFNAIQNQKPVPNITLKQENFPKISNMNYFQHYMNNLFMAADNVLFIWETNGSMNLTEPFTRLDEKFFGKKELAIVDFTFYKDRIYIVDTLNGIFLIGLKESAKGKFEDNGVQHSLRGGTFIQTVGESLFVVVNTRKYTRLYEYTISAILTLNREAELYQPVIDIYSDGKYLYPITGFFNTVVRPMIPWGFGSEFTFDYVLGYWSLPDAYAVVPTQRSGVSQLLSVHQRTLAVYSFEEDDPTMECKIEKVPEGEYHYELMVRQTDCDEKESNAFEVFCETKQNVTFVIGAFDAIGDVSHSRMISFGLIIGIGIFFVLLLLFIGMLRKYKKKYSSLESQYKFKQFKDEDKDSRSFPRVSKIEDEEEI